MTHTVALFVKAYTALAFGSIFTVRAISAVKNVNTMEVTALSLISSDALDMRKSMLASSL